MIGRRRLKVYGRRKKIFSRELVKEIFSYVLTTVVAVCLALFLVYGFGRRTRNIGESMEPSLYHGQSVLIDRARYLLLSPGRNSVIVFLPNGNTASHYYIKRVVALPGDRVQIMGNELYVNGVMLSAEDTGFDKIEDAGIAENELVLQDDEFFVLGDNRNASEDSRSANIGPVKKEQIIGAAWFKYGGDEGDTGFVN